MTDFYADNVLTNPGAETGNTSGWSAVGVTAVAGGATGAYCFKAPPSSSLSQTYAVPEPGTPPDPPAPPEPAEPAEPPSVTSAIKVSAKVMPQYPRETEAGVEAKVKAVINYSDGTKDIVELPCQLGVE